MKICMAKKEQMQRSFHRFFGDILTMFSQTEKYILNFRKTIDILHKTVYNIIEPREREEKIWGK